eukprot:GHVL01021788.1.p1 GENE.GHVL01021788.1~~GHVL01021788.1.p1  ORF type:complete len:458 (-),score=84.88 GHVL01021788.1:2099-3283(-)
MALYTDRGVSSSKADVHNAVNKSTNCGIFKNTFCKIVEDYLGGDEEYCNVMHSDGAGTKVILAYLMWKETGNDKIWRGISQDAVIMNIDDLLCVGAVFSTFLVSSTIGRNSFKITGDVISNIIQGNERICQELTKLNLPCVTVGGETADIGDICRSIVVDSTVTCRMKRSDVITNEDISAGDIIIGLSSTGQTTYEDTYNSGIGSNGLTLARHELLSHEYAKEFKECVDDSMDDSLIFRGKYKLSDQLPHSPLTIGQALLSPTRTYAPIIKDILSSYRDKIKGIFHCTGGGQTKCLRFGKGIIYKKNNLFECPAIFQAIQEASKADWREMYQVFNMGHRMEIVASPDILPEIQKICDKYNVDMKQVGICESSSDDENTCIIESTFGKYIYSLNE